jgi:hypothetical protein
MARFSGAPGSFKAGAMAARYVEGLGGLGPIDPPSRS